VALGISLFGFIFAAIGAVMIQPRATIRGTIGLSNRKSGLISLAGPATNIGLAVEFLVLDAFRPTLLFTLGAYVNRLLALFNLILFSHLDGVRVFRGNNCFLLIAMAEAGG